MTLASPRIFPVLPKYCDGLTEPDYDGSEHALWLVQYGLCKCSKTGNILAYCIAGHVGLPISLTETPNGALPLTRRDSHANEPQVAEWISTQLKLFEIIKLAPPWKFNESDMSTGFVCSTLVWWMPTFLTEASVDQNGHGSRRLS